MSQFIFIEEDKVKEYELMAKELEWYKDACQELIGDINKLKDAFLGPGYYIVDPVNNLQAAGIIVDDVIRNYAPRKYINKDEKKKEIREMKRLKELFLNIINLCDCPFDPEDNPFPQSCDKRIIFTDKCSKCAWRNKDES